MKVNPRPPQGLGTASIQMVLDITERLIQDNPPAAVHPCLTLAPLGQLTCKSTGVANSGAPSRRHIVYMKKVKLLFVK